MRCSSSYGRGTLPMKIELKNTGIREQVIKEIIDFAKKYDVEKVLLFGSRARGDFKRTSDIDLAVSGGDFDRFALDVNEETTTLLMFDIIDLDREMQPELRESIEKEGVVLYEEKKFISMADMDRSGSGFDRGSTYAYPASIH